MPSTICSIENESVDNHLLISILPSYPLHFRSLGIFENFWDFFSEEIDLIDGINAPVYRSYRDLAAADLIWTSWRRNKN